MKNIEKRNNVVCDVEGKRFRVDGCIRELVCLLNIRGIQTIGSCCGHNRYPPSIVYRTSHNGIETLYELISGVEIPRKKRFYLKDKDGFFFIPEAIKELHKEVK